MDLPRSDRRAITEIRIDDYEITDQRFRNNFPSLCKRFTRTIRACFCMKVVKKNSRWDSFKAHREIDVKVSSERVLVHSPDLLICWHMDMWRHTCDTRDVEQMFVGEVL